MSEQVDGRTLLRSFYLPKQLDDMPSAWVLVAALALTFPTNSSICAQETETSHEADAARVQAYVASSYFQKGMSAHVVMDTRDGVDFAGTAFVDGEAATCFATRVGPQSDYQYRWRCSVASGDVFLAVRGHSDGLRDD